MKRSSPSEVRRAQKSSLLFKEISELFLHIVLDNPELKDLYPNEVKLSPDGSMCTIFFFSPHGKKYFEEKLNTLKLFKPSLRAALSQRVSLRRTPDLFFKYDDTYEKQQRIESVLEHLKAKGDL